MLHTKLAVPKFSLARAMRIVLTSIHMRAFERHSTSRKDQFEVLYGY